jgi:hypothetical protein
MLKPTRFCPCVSHPQSLCEVYIINAIIPACGAGIAGNAWIVEELIDTAAN